MNEDSYLQPALRAAPNAEPELPFPPQLMDPKDLQKEKDENLIDYLMGDSKISTGRCITNDYDASDLDRFERGWEEVLRDQQEQSTGIFNKIGVGLDGGNLTVPNVELMKRKRNKAEVYTVVDSEYEIRLNAGPSSKFEAI